MNNTRITVTDKELHRHKAPLVIVPIDEKKKLPIPLSKQTKRKIRSIIALGDMSGKKEESVLLYHDTPDQEQNGFQGRLLLVGVGSVAKNNTTDIKENLRIAGGIIAQTAKKIKVSELAIVLPDYLTQVPCFGAEQLLEGVLLGDYQFLKYKKQKSKKERFDGIGKIALLAAKNLPSIRKAVNRARSVSDAVITARNMANEPGNKWTPVQFADYAQNLAKNSSLKCRIIDQEAMKKAGMGGILGVSQGSAVPPKLVILEHLAKHYSKTILLVGKGLTFDSGGISIKPSAGMEEMKYDMCGGAAVISTMQAIAEEAPAINVVALIPSSENLSGAKAIKPGDIITHYNGITSEVINTDAEGRLILADALAYGIKTYKPNCVIDLATLTGAVIISLGHHRTGLMSNNDRLASKLYEAGESCGEPLWRLPLGEDYTKQIDSDVADIKNIGGREGGSITAGAYLEKFVGETPWAHLDIAGTAWGFTKKSYIPKGPSGIGVRTLVEFIRNWKKNIK